MSYFKSRPDPISLGQLQGDQKSCKRLRVEGSGWNLMGRMSTNPKYMIELTGTDLLLLGELGGGVNSEKLEEVMYF